MAPQASSEAIAKARTNATGPFTGPVVLMACLDFTMKPLEEYVLVGAMGRNVKTLYLVVNTFRPSFFYCVVNIGAP